MINTELSSYQFEKEDYPSKWVRWHEELHYGDAFDAKDDCGAKAYEILCDNSLFDDDVVKMTDEGHLMISPHMMQSDET